MDVRKRIEQAAKSGAKKLYLSGNKLTALPPEIRELGNLEWLDLSGNKLTEAD